MVVLASEDEGSHNPLLNPGIGMAMQCPHCHQIKLGGIISFDLWEAADDETRYYIFHETTSFLRDYWATPGLKYDYGTKKYI